MWAFLPTSFVWARGVVNPDALDDGRWVIWYKAYFLQRLGDIGAAEA